MTDTKVQRVAREGAYRERQLELGAGLGIEVAALQHARNGLAAPQNLGFLVASAQHVHRRAGRQQQEAGSREHRAVLCRRHRAAPAVFAI
jgi:hypothetical protein